MSIAEKLTTIAENQRVIYDHAFHEGYGEGNNSGWEIGWEAGVEQGKQAEWNTFWENFQQSGNLTDYSYAFYGARWTDENFKPKYDIKPTYSTQTFNACGIKDLAGCLERAGVVLDTSNASSFAYLFFNSQIEHLPTISLVGTSKISYTFYQMLNLHTIDKLIFKDDGSQTFEYAFYCPKLANLVIEGVIGNNPSVASCTSLSHDSLMSIINHLKDYAGTGTTMKLSIGTTNLNKLTADEKKIATGRGWTLA